MILAVENLRYEIRRGASLVAAETVDFDGRRLVSIRSYADSSNRYEAVAELNDDGSVARLTVKYARAPFERTAVYEAAGDILRGQITAIAGRNAVSAKLGRYREIDADLIIYRALTIARIRARGQLRWTGRVVTIDTANLVAASVKQSARALDPAGRRWIYEPRMGDQEEIELDAAGRIVRRSDNRGFTATLSAVDPRG